VQRTGSVSSGQGGIHDRGTWADYFPAALGAAGLCDSVRWHSTVLDLVQRRAAPGTRLIEVGCGLAAPAIYLSDKGYEVWAIDSSADLVGRAQRTAARMGSRAHFAVMDLFDMGFGDGAFEVAYNHGVLEHFGDEQIGRALREMTRIARTVVVSVPTIHHRVQDYGDERLLPVRQWLRLLEPFRVADVCGWDHSMSWQHDLFRAWAVLGRRIARGSTEFWHAALFARQVAFVLEAR